MLGERGLLERAREWVAPYWNARHLYRTLDWLFVLEPEADIALRLAALTHDMERHVPGPDSPTMDAQRGIPNREYERQHQERSARIVTGWLTEQGAAPELVEAVRALVAVHEWGGWPEADLLQAADSLSFLEVNVDRFVRLGLTGERGYTPERVAEHFRYMAERVRVPRARHLAELLLRAALARLEEQSGHAGAELARLEEAVVDG
ncbi:DUF4202 domain-containing protein [Thermomicrobium sp. 4228-Ro]|uniref:DUF4202 family protein n=1 Tax=Thermomicrobium sp. 4228-Ro TaxID=2993937 RepID=UPI002248F3F4|nr:DUF4202 family protein [Thermomicrobium sp. 4228-Ro]MCX2727983.1 DUF4202 domain-containing protein [Thermomicrobium sp. 4228-Ro]